MTGKNKIRYAAYLGLVILISVAMARDETMADSSVSTPCTKVGPADPCNDGSPTYPDLIRCGDFAGYGNFSSFTGAAQPPLFDSPGCPGDASPHTLGGCMYVSTPHGAVTQQSVADEMIDGQSENVDFISTTTTAKGCGKAGIPAPGGNTQQAFCSGMIACRGGQAHFKVCRASSTAGTGACPTADQCETDLSGPDSGFQVKADTGLNTNSQLQVKRTDLFAAIDQAVNGKADPKLAESVVNQPGASPVVISNAAGNSICVVPVQSLDPQDSSSSYIVATSQTSSKGGCPKDLKTVFNDKCVNPSDQTQIQAYSATSTPGATAPAGSAEPAE